ncbi:MAG: CvpA family protein [Saprospiraceae bacterium]|jgi:membrane protein required for colicin V production|nr:CvpA family protein [Saprospiraceae bacterium]MBL0025525.1 CvpA family protein [Saprospiraceae bacterium]
MLIDLFVAIVIALGFYLGYSRGLIKTVFDSLSLVIGILAALKLSPIMINILQEIIKTSAAITFILGVVITFIAVMALIRFLGRKLEDMLEAVHINFVNKIAGGILQGLFFAYLLSLSLWLINTLSVLNPETKAASITYPMLEPLPEKGKAVFTSIKPLFKGFWDKTVEAMDGINGDKKDGKTQK